MTELDFLPAVPDPTRPEREPRRLHRHRYDVARVGTGQMYPGSSLPNAWWECPCGAVRDETAARRGKSNARFGKDQERRIERVYGLRKVGEFGDAVDLLGKTTKWQSRATRGAIPQWLARVNGVTAVPGTPEWIRRPFRAMGPLFPMRVPVLIRPVVRHGLPTVDYIFMVTGDWWAWHGDPVPRTPFLVMRGETWLSIHGREGA